MTDGLVFEAVHGAELISAVSKLAYELWTIHYKPPMCSEAQTVYMLDKYQSIAAITQQIEHEQYEYFLVYDRSHSDKPVGYLATCPAEEEPLSLCLSKFYVVPDARGRGYARKMSDFAVEIAKKHGCTSLHCYCNRRNPSVAVYKKLGYHVDREADTPIGEGYVCEDYVFKLDFAK